MGAHCPVFLVVAVVAVVGRNHGIGRPFLHEDVIVEPVVAVEEGHKAHDLGVVRNMVGGYSGICTAAHASKSPADQVMNHGHALCGKPQSGVGKENIVIDQSGGRGLLQRKYPGFIMPPFRRSAKSGLWLLYKRFWVMRVPWASQSHQMPMVQSWIQLCGGKSHRWRRSLIPAISAPPSSIMLLM